MRRLFQHEEPEGIIIQPAMSDGWSACLQTLKGHSHWVYSVVFSHNSTQLASASYNRTVKIWDASSGACLQTLDGHSDKVTSVAFSHASVLLASASHDSTVKIWDASSGACLQNLYISEAHYPLPFNTTSSILYTEIGTIIIQRSKVSHIIGVVEYKRPLRLGTSLSSDNIWVQCGGNNMLWVPSEY
jgi:WD40 repeat protein